MKVTDQALLDLIEADYRSNHMYWIERRLNKHFERWFRHKKHEEKNEKKIWSTCMKMKTYLCLLQICPGWFKTTMAWAAKF